MQVISLASRSPVRAISTVMATAISLLERHLATLGEVYLPGQRVCITAALQA